MNFRLHACIAASLLVLPLTVHAAKAVDADAKALQDAQRQLNQQTIERRFSAPDPAAVETYVRDGMTRNMDARRQPPSYWRQGDTCETTLQYSQQDYLDCVYYQRRVGHQWW